MSTYYLGLINTIIDLYDAGKSKGEIYQDIIKITSDCKNDYFTGVHRQDDPRYLVDIHIPTEAKLQLLEKRVAVLEDKRKEEKNKKEKPRYEDPLPMTIWDNLKDTK